MNETATKKQDAGPKLGIFDDIDNETYHRGPGISKSGLDLVGKNPAHYMARKLNPRKPTTAMVFGSAFHGIVLEYDKFDSEFAVDPAPGSRSKLAIAEREAMEEEGKTIVHTAKDAGYWDRDDWRAIHAMRDSVFSHPLASILLNPDDGTAEQSVYWIDPATGELCRCRSDFYNEAHNVIVDLKSTEDASADGFAKSCANFGYHRQDAFYTDGFRSINRDVKSFIFIAVEKSPPYSIACYVLNQEARHVGGTQCRDLLYLYHECRVKNEWLAYPSEIRDLELPRWAMKVRVM